ncbi:unnamed protein product, partial [Hapterophycus canaliculatus]
MWPRVRLEMSCLGSRREAAPRPLLGKPESALRVIRRTSSGPVSEDGPFVFEIDRTISSGSPHDLRTFCDSRVHPLWLLIVCVAPLCRIRRHLLAGELWTQTGMRTPEELRSLRFWMEQPLSTYHV